MVAPEEQLLVFVLGAPGAGKGTQCDRVVESMGWAHVSAGDLLRAEVEAGTPAGQQAQGYIREGKMVPAAMIIGLLRNALASCGRRKVLIDGFPRKLDQLREFEQQVRPADAVLFYNVAEEVARERILKRGESSGRVDDNEETIRKRFVVFTNESLPVVEELRKEGKVIEVDGGGPPDQVFAATRRAIEQLEAQQAARDAAAAGTAAAEAAATAPAAAERAASSSSPSAAALPAAAVAAGAGAAAAAAGATAVVNLTSPSKADKAAADPAAAPAANAAAAAAAATPAATPAAMPAANGSSVGGVQMDLSGILTPIVICGPSGVGKGTLISKLMAANPKRFGFSVSHTTRAPRPGEAHGVHYYFTDQAAMAPQVAAGMFLEHAVVHGNMYGTSLAAVARVSAEGKHCVLDIDVQGAQLVRASAVGASCLFIFVAPPSHAELERRLRNRGTESEDKVAQRLENAKSEIAKAQEPGLFHHTLVNGDLDTAFAELTRLIAARVPGMAPAPAPAPALAPAAAANGGGTSTLLDFGFGASAGPAVAAKGMPVRAYMDATVIPVLREALKALNVARPDDPLQYLADYLLANKPLAH